jgi:hypothetical protein
VLAVGRLPCLAIVRIARARPAHHWCDRHRNRRYDLVCCLTLGIIPLVAGLPRDCPHERRGAKWVMRQETFASAP